jgi:hypothetical protein
MSKPELKMRYSVRGKPQTFFEARGVDELVAISMALAQELWTVKERQAVMESIVRNKGIMVDEEIERHEFSDSERAAMDSEREAFIDRIFFVLKEQAEGLKVADPDEPPPPSLYDDD